MAMVERYAHMPHERVANVAANIDGLLRHKNGTPISTLHGSTSSKRAPLLVAWGGIEPPTQGFSVLCSTN